jgi:copper chaperone CopZ
MEKKTFQVPNIGCDGCVKSIKNEVSALQGVTFISGDVATKTVTLEWNTPATWQQIEAALTEIDYAPAKA